MAPSLGVSATQQRMWLTQKRPPGFSNHVTILWDIRGEIDLDRRERPQARRGGRAVPELPAIRRGRPVLA